MSDPFIGEIRMFGGTFAPVGWLMCDGSLQPISLYLTLYELLGTTYGGDGNTNFGLPDMRGRVPIHTGQGQGLQSYPMGQLAGSSSVALAAVNLPAHTHAFQAVTDAATTATAQGGMVAATGQVSIYAERGANVALAASAIGTAAGLGMAHENRMPSLTLTFIICTEGIFPSQ
jgi:microcystin-dependent protein